MKNILAIFLFISCFSCNEKSEIENETIMKYNFLVGSYTASEAEGIGLLTFNPNNQELVYKSIAAGVSNPSFVLQSDDFIFSVEENEEGSIKSFRWNQDNTQLIEIDQESSHGAHPCHIAVKEGLLAVSNYSGGNFSIYRMSTEGQLDFLQTIQHEGSSINLDRQEAAHVHSANFSPDGRFLLVVDLGTDHIYTYQIERNNSEPASLLSKTAMTLGDGPRYLAFSPEGDEVYVVQELTAVLEVFSYQEGNLSSKQRLSLLEPNFEGTVGAAEVRVTKDGKFLYASNRGDANTISVFGKNESGQFETVQHISSGGDMPRNFSLTYDEKYLLVAHQESENVVVFERNIENGKLTPTSIQVSAPKPVYLFSLEN
jgi:6-phosphogluconolactonase (cycloisomerase 2 family)